jgi:uncharacterized protein YndB with AHSA1/START domain
MTVTSVDKDVDNLTLRLVADFDAPAERVWDLWADPRKLEKWWGPPGYPATFEEHDLVTGGSATYYMTSPEGDTHRGWWRITAVDPPRSIEITDGFADQDGNPNPELPEGKMVVEFTPRDGGTRMVIRSIFDSREQMDQLMEMGQAEGMHAAAGQMDALLAA